MADLTPVAVVFHSVHIFYNTPDLLTGVPIWVPARAEEVILTAGFVSVSTVWNTTAVLHIFAMGDNPISGALNTLPTDMQGNLDPALGTHAKGFSDTPFPAAAVQMIDMTPVMINVDDGAGGSPGASQGEATIVIAVGASYLPGVSSSTNPGQA